MLVSHRRESLKESGDNSRKRKDERCLEGGRPRGVVGENAGKEARNGRTEGKEEGGFCLLDGRLSGNEGGQARGQDDWRKLAERHDSRTIWLAVSPLTKPKLKQRGAAAKRDVRYGTACSGDLSPGKRFAVRGQTVPKANSKEQERSALCGCEDAAECRVGAASEKRGRAFSKWAKEEEDPLGNDGIKREQGSNEEG